MVLKRIIFVLLAAVFVFPGGAVTQAQDQPRLIVWADDELWLVEGTTLTNLTHTGDICCAALSPDGTQIAYRYWAPGMRIRGDGTLPANIAVLNLMTFEITTIAAQPDGASFGMEGVPDDAILRSGPTWSPDGTRLAWGELHTPSFAPETDRLVIYDFNRGTTDVLVTHLPETVQAGASAFEPTWGNGGLVIIVYEYDLDNDDSITRLYIYSDEDGRLLSSIPFSGNDYQHFRLFLWVHGGGTDEIAVQYVQRGNWGLITPDTGRLHPALAVPELYNPLVPASATITFSYNPDGPRPNFDTWTVTYPDGRQSVEPYPIKGFSQVALGPDGQTLALIADKRLIWLAPDGQITEGPVIDDYAADLFWGPAAWRIDQPAACGDALPPRLIVGDYGVVRGDTTPNNLRDQPATGEILGQLQPGDMFLVIEGPECVDGLYWWKVDNLDGVVGWTAEGNSQTYWVNPTLG